MKKIIITCLFAIALHAISFAQIDQEQLRQELETMEEQLAQAFKMFEGTLQDGKLLEGLDTIMFKMIPMDPAQVESEVYPNGDPYQLHHFLDQFMGSFNEDNMVELEQFFKELEQRLPVPEDLQDSTEPSEKQGNTTKKSRKKSKVYKL